MKHFKYFIKMVIINTNKEMRGRKMFVAQQLTLSKLQDIIGYTFL
jgi:hypothetical protein